MVASRLTSTVPKVACTEQICTISLMRSSIARLLVPFFFIPGAGFAARDASFGPKRHVLSGDQFHDLAISEVPVMLLGLQVQKNMQNTAHGDFMRHHHDAFRTVPQHPILAQLV